MTNTADRSTDAQSQGELSASFRRVHLFKHPQDGWTVITNKLADGIESGEAALPECAGMDIEHVVVHSRMDEAKQRWAVRMQRGLWFLDDQGKLDQARDLAEMVRTVNGAPGLVPLDLNDAEYAEVMAVLRATRGRPSPKYQPSATKAEEPERATAGAAPAPKRIPTVAEYLTAVIDGSDLSQTEISDACGFKRPNMISMMKAGHTRVPIDKIRPLAKALGVDPMYLFRLVFGEYQAEVLAFFDEMVDREVAARA